MTKPIKYTATYQGKTVGTRRSPRPYQFAIVAQHNVETARQRAYNYQPTATDKRNFEFATFKAMAQPGAPAVHPDGFTFHFKAEEIAKAQAEIAGDWSAYATRLRQREIQIFESYLAKGHYEPHVAAWSMSRANADKASRRMTGTVLAIVPAVPASDKTAPETAPAAATPTLKDTLDGAGLVEIRNGAGDVIAKAYRFDEDYVFKGLAGSHRIAYDTTDAARLEAHWNGFAEACTNAGDAASPAKAYGAWKVTEAEYLDAQNIAGAAQSSEDTAADAWQLVRYCRGQIFNRDPAERALQRIRNLKPALCPAAAKTIGWKSEPKGPGKAVHMFLDAEGERVELLAYDCPASHGGPRMCGFEVFGRLRKGGPFHDQLAAGEAASLTEAMEAAQAMVARPRDTWVKLPRSWVKP